MKLFTHRGRLIGLTFLVLLLAGAVMASFYLGARSVSIATVSEALRGWIGGSPLPDATDTADIRVVRELRIPRTFLGLAVGAALGAAGALIQGITRNPLADPGILGISQGASLAVVLSFAVLGEQHLFATAGWAIVGALCATAGVFTIAAIGGGRINPLTLILGGAALSAVLGSVTGSLVLLKDSNLDTLRFWTVGAVSGRHMEFVTLVAPILCALVLLSLTMGSKLNVLTLGDDAAQGLGMHPARTRALGIVLIAALAGVATAAAGPIGFVALVTPHLARVFTGPDYRWIIAYSALFGAALLLSADVIGRVIARPSEVEVGIVLAFVGAPFFIAVMTRTKKVVAL